MEFKGEGRRKDGKPFKEGNTNDDGSYKVGKNRTPEDTRFAVGDNRKRGRRAKGVKNFDTDWEEELTAAIKIKVNGVLTRMSAHRAQVKVTMDAARSGNMKAQQIVYDKAARVLMAKSERTTFSDDGIIEAWLAQLGIAGQTGIVGDDASHAPAAPERGNEGGQHPDGSPGDDQ